MLPAEQGLLLAASAKYQEDNEGDEDEEQEHEVHEG